MIKYHKIEQKSEEWFEAKDGLKSASNATPIGANGKGLKTYARRLAKERLGVKTESFTNADMERGNEYEPYATLAYSMETGLTLYEIGGVTNDLYPYVWVSPDGLIDDDPEGLGGCEVKARNDDKHFGLFSGETAEIPFNQIQMSLLITERKWWDFVSYNPNFDKPIFIKRIYPDLAYFEKLKKGFIECEKLIDECIEKYMGYKNNVHVEAKKFDIGSYSEKVLKKLEDQIKPSFEKEKIEIQDSTSEDPTPW